MTVHVGLLLEADLESSAAASESVAALQAQLQQVTQDTGKARERARDVESDHVLRFRAVACIWVMAHVMAEAASGCSACFLDSGAVE